MFKKTQKIFAVLALMLVLMATTCFATEDTAVVTSEISADTTLAVDESSIDDEHNHEEDEDYTEDQELYENDLYVFEDTIAISNLVDGNAYAVGKEVTVSGKIGGDLFVFADNLTLTGDSYIYGNLFVCANTVNIEGIVCDLYAICSDLTIAETGIVLRDMRTGSNALTIAGSVGRNTYVTATNIAVGEVARIYGDFNYSSTQAIEVPSGVVEGSINYSEIATTDTEGRTVINYVMDCVYAIVYTLVILGVMILLAPKFLSKLPEMVSKKSLPAFGLGLLGLIVPVPVAILLIFTTVGTPVAFALIAVWAFAVFALSFAVTAIAIASFVGSKVSILGKVHNVLAVILVTIVLWALQQIPFTAVQLIVNLLIYAFGLGYLLLGIFKKNKKEE